MSHKNQNSELKGCKMGRTVFRPYQKRLECATISICHNKGSTFSSVIFKTSSTGLFSLAFEVGRPTYKAREKRPGDEVENLSVGPAVVEPTTPGGRYSLI